MPRERIVVPADEVNWKLTPSEAQFILAVMRTRQDDCRKVTGEDFPPMIKGKFETLYVKLEQVKMKLVEQM